MFVALPLDNKIHISCFSLSQGRAHSFWKHIFRKDIYLPFDHFLYMKLDITSELCQTAGAKIFKETMHEFVFPSLHMSFVASCVIVLCFFLWKLSYTYYCNCSGAYQSEYMVFDLEFFFCKSIKETVVVMLDWVLPSFTCKGPTASAFTQPWMLGFFITVTRTLRKEGFFVFHSSPEKK